MKTVKVKICGLTNPQDVMNACQYGADLLGFVFISGTPRYVYADKVNIIMQDVPPVFHKDKIRAGLFMDEKAGRVEEAAREARLNCIQLHGEESPEFCSRLKTVFSGKIKIMKVFKVTDRILPCAGHGHAEYDDADYFVFDTYNPDIPGGTGEKYDWDIIVKEKGRINKPFFIAGGLNPENVKQVINQIQPYGVDVSSGVEVKPGVKKEKFLKEFIQNAKEVQIT